MAPIFLPTNLFDSSEFRWDINGNGSIIDGTNDAFDGGLNLVGFPFLENGETEDNGREIAIGGASIDGVEVQRKIYVPEDQSFARFLEIVTNAGSSTVNYTVNINTDLGSDGSTVLVGTSSGDNIFNTDDNWLVTDDDIDGSGDPTIVQVIAGEDGIVQPNSAFLDLDNINFTYNLSLEPGETQIVMHFAAQNGNQVEALAKASELELLELGALQGISEEEVGQIVNFSIISPPDVIGTDDDNVLIGTNAGELIDGRGGNDFIRGLGGNDQIFGGDNNDLIRAGDGNDNVEGGTGSDNILGNNGNDSLWGNEGDDDIFGGDGNDEINGGSGRDRLLGEAGNDIIDGNNGNDTIDGGTGNDTVNGSSGNDRLFGDNGSDTLSGGDDNDTLSGGFGNDSLHGDEGDDRLIGVDSITAGSGVGFGADEVDTLTGAAGADTFVLGDETRIYYSDGDPLTSGDSDYALITDLNEGEDVIELQGSADLYSLDFFTTTTGSIDALLIYDPGVTARGEIIGILQNVSPDLTISSESFSFV